MYRALAALLLLLMTWPAAAGVPVSADFVETEYGSNIVNPTCIAFPPDGSGRVFVCMKRGTIGVIPAGGGPVRTFANIAPIYTESECGLLGLCFDPDYLHNRLLYVFVTVSSTQQRIFRLRDLNGRGVERVALPMILPTAGRNHDGGALGIGPDAHLYWAVGDNGMHRGVNADLTTLAAKVGRANLDGTAPTDNPFYDGRGPRNDYIWATGFRNPFTMAFEPRTGRLWLNVVGSAAATNGYEQIFWPDAGDDGGWDQYEGNQPSEPRFIDRPFAYVALQYKTDVGNSTAHNRAIATIERNAGRLTVTLTQPHPYRVGQLVLIAGTQGFNGSYVIESVQGTSGFVTQSPGLDGPGLANTGSVRLPSTEGCVIGGCFYEGTSYPPETRGNYFFGDLQSGNVWQMKLGENSQPVGIAPFVTNAGDITSVAMGRDGAIYYSELSSTALHRVSYRQPVDLIVTPTTQRLTEGSLGIFTVRLPSAPAGPVTVTVTPEQVSNVTFEDGNTLTFTPENWNVAQGWRLSAPVDAAFDDKNLSFTVAAEGYANQTVRIAVTDTSIQAPMILEAPSEVAAGATAEFKVRLPVQPLGRTVVVARVAVGGTYATIVKRRLLVFTPENYETPQTVQVRTARVRQERPMTVALTSPGYFRRTVTLGIQPTAP